MYGAQSFVSSQWNIVSKEKWREMKQLGFDGGYPLDMNMVSNRQGYIILDG